MAETRGWEDNAAWVKEASGKFNYHTVIHPGIAFLVSIIS